MVPLSLSLSDFFPLDASPTVQHLEVELLNRAISIAISIARERGVWCRFSVSNDTNLSWSTREELVDDIENL